VICDNTLFIYTPASDVPGAVFTWSRNTVPGISNPQVINSTDFPISETLDNTATGQRTVHYRISVSAGGCSNPTVYDLPVTVNPTPILTSTLTPSAICSGATFNYTPVSNLSSPLVTEFQWTRADIPGISPAGPQSGTGNPMEALTNSTSASITVTYNYTLSVNGCTNPTTYQVSVIVRPVPVLTSTLTPPPICSGTTFSYNPQSSPATQVTFSWNRQPVTGITPTGPTNGTVNINESLVNTTPNPITVTYVYTLTHLGCFNPEPFNVSVVVNPRPVLTSTLTPPAICTGTAFNYTPASSTPGTTFTWSRASVPGISPVGTTGSGAISETLINTTTAPITVHYIYSLLSNGCTSATTSDVAVVVNPIPALSSSLTPPAICSGSLFSYNPTSVTPGTGFAWNRSNVPGITPAGPVSGVDNPNEALTNTTTGPLNVIYAYTLTANGCQNTQNVTVRINSTPSVSAIGNQAYCANATVPLTSVSGTPSGATFTWTNNNTAIGLASGGTGNIPSFTAINTTSDPITATISITPSANGCTGPPSGYTITVFPAPVLSSPLNPPAICSGTEFSYEPSSSSANVTFEWSRAAVGGISNLAANGTGNPHEILNSTTSSPVDVTYRYTLRANGCANPATFNVVVRVNPVPVLTSSTTLTVCSGTLFNYTPNSGTSGTTFSWMRPVVAGISNPEASGTGNINETLINTTNVT
jgi:hypothetical protein